MDIKKYILSVSKNAKKMLTYPHLTEILIFGTLSKIPAIGSYLSEIKSGLDEEKICSIMKKFSEEIYSKLEELSLEMEKIKSSERVSSEVEIVKKGSLEYYMQELGKEIEETRKYITDNIEDPKEDFVYDFEDMFSKVNSRLERMAMNYETLKEKMNHLEKSVLRKEIEEKIEFFQVIFTLSEEQKEKIISNLENSYETTYQIVSEHAKKDEKFSKIFEDLKEIIEEEKFKEKNHEIKLLNYKVKSKEYEIRSKELELGIVRYFKDHPEEERPELCPEAKLKLAHIVKKEQVLRKFLNIVMNESYRELGKLPKTERYSGNDSLSEAIRKRKIFNKIFAIQFEKLIKEYPLDEDTKKS